MDETYTVSEMRLIERVAAAMYESPDPNEPDYQVSQSRKLADRTCKHVRQTMKTGVVGDG